MENKIHYNKGAMGAFRVFLDGFVTDYERLMAENVSLKSENENLKSLIPAPAVTNGEESGE